MTVKRKPPKKKKSGKSKKKKPSVKRELLKVFTGIAALVFVVATLAMVADYMLNKDVGKKQERVQKKDVPRKKNPIRLKPGPEKTKPIASTSGEHSKKTVFEVFGNTVSPGKPIRTTKPILIDGTPRVTIIIDDIGFDKKSALALAALDSNITFSILPGATFSRTIAERIHKMGGQIMLHLPMEPMEYPEIDPGPEAILSAMSPDELINQLRRNLNAFSHISGVNNHMGSRITTLSPKMNQVFTVLKQRNLFFIDSRTSKDTLCRSSARLLQVPFGQRDVFLDNIQEPDYIRGQIKELIKAARKHGTAIGIGHPYEATVRALKAELPKMKKKVRLVPASTLVAVPG